MAGYTVEMVRHFDRVPMENVRVDVSKTFAAPFLRRGVETRESPEKTRDEAARLPAAELFIPKEVIDAGARIVNTKKFTPEYLVNLQGVEVERDSIVVRVNHINYGVVPALRDLTGMFPEDLMKTVLNQLAPVAVRGVLISPKEGTLYLARRANVAQSGKIDTYPAGTVSEGDDLESALRKEADEEVGLKLGNDVSAELIGIVKGRRDGPNPNFTFRMVTEKPLKEIEAGTVGKEHDKVYPIRLDEKIVQETIRGLVLDAPDHSRITDVGLGALLQAGRIEFTNGWYEETKSMLHSMKEPEINIIEDTL